MQFSLFNASKAQQVTDLFTAVFSSSEGEEEGASIGNLVTNLIANTKSEDLIGFVATDETKLLGCIFFSRFWVSSGETAFMLSPVAIDTKLQGTGIGQRLLRYGLAHLKSQGVSLAITYGDPAFYSKVGFEQISEDIVEPPFTLSQPIGWLAQSLDGQPIQARHGASKCVEAFNDPKYW